MNNDDDLIRRGDALAACAPIYGWSIAAAEELEEAIEALPAVAFDEFVPFLKTANEASREQLIVLCTNILAALKGADHD